jgi:hypothetical protein
MSVTVAPAAESDLWKDHFGDPYCAVLTAGNYVIADPALILAESDYEKWHKVATISEVQFGQYGDGHDGIIHSGRINSQSVTGFTVYGCSDEYRDTSGNAYESSSARQDHSLLAVFPIELLKELGIAYPTDHVFTVTADDVEEELNEVYYSTRTHRMFVGRFIEIYTGELGGALDEIDAENARDEEMYAELLGYSLDED